jgi:hypothetical protein
MRMRNLGGHEKYIRVFYMRQNEMRPIYWNMIRKNQKL